MHLLKALTESPYIAVCMANTVSEELGTLENHAVYLRIADDERSNGKSQRYLIGHCWKENAERDGPCSASIKTFFTFFCL